MGWQICYLFDSVLDKTSSFLLTASFPTVSIAFLGFIKCDSPKQSLQNKRKVVLITPYLSLF
jgi:hypothetical protein